MKTFISLHDPEAVRLLKQGAVAVIPTDTVYGLVCRADNPRSVERLYALKKREHKPGTLIAADTDQLVALGIEKKYLAAAEHFWPGSVSVIIPTPALNYLRQDVVGLAVRVPAAGWISDFLAMMGPLLTSSANQPGEPPATTVDDAYHYFGDMVDFYIDGGNRAGARPSTIVRITDRGLELIRQGAVSIPAEAFAKPLSSKDLAACLAGTDAPTSKYSRLHESV